MKFFLLLSQLINATYVTYKLAAHERACFYVDAKRASEKIGFYFSVGLI
jgi:hypothetical protein